MFLILHIEKNSTKLAQLEFLLISSREKIDLFLSNFQSIFFNM